jgi:hypothetical protein
VVDCTQVPEPLQVPALVAAPLAQVAVPHEVVALG